jgi:hypothetical protein
MANTNEAMVYGWTPQALGATTGESGYAQPGVNTSASTVSTAEQPSAGAPFPAKSGVTKVLTNPGYASATQVAAGPNPYYPESFGAKGDGVTDDAPAILAAMAAAGPTGGTVNLTLGKNYLINAPLKYDKSAATTPVLAPSLIGAPGLPGSSSDIGNYGTVQITCGPSFPVGEFVIDYIGPVQTSASPPLAMTGFTIQGLALRCASKGAGIRVVQEEDATIRDCVVTNTATPAPANNTGSPKAAINLVPPTTGYSFQYNNRVVNCYVFLAARDGFYCSEGFASSVTLDRCSSVQAGRYGFNCGPQTELLYCDSQTSVTASYYVIGTTMIGCTEYFASQGNSVRTNLDNTPWSANPPAPTVFIGCSFQGTSTGSLSEANGSVINMQWVGQHIIFSGCSFVGGSGTTDWVYVNGSNTSSAQALFSGCQFGAFYSAPATHLYNLNGSGASLSFQGCTGITSGTAGATVSPVLVATTGASGFVMAGGTPNILTWTAPNDGNLHRVVLSIVFVVNTSPTAGGGIALFTHFNGASCINATILSASDSAGLGTGPYAIPARAIFGENLSSTLLGPGDTITIQQGAALTGGAATVYAEIWGS